MLSKFIGPALLLCCIAIVPYQVVNGQECYSYGYYDININRDAFNFDYESQAYEGPVEICVNSEYESVCDIGWDQSDAQVVCRQLFGYNYVAEPLYNLGHPRNRYTNRTFHCDEYNYYLGNCYSTLSIDEECFNGSHVAGVRCKEVCYEGSMSVQTEPEYHEHGMRTYVGQVKVCINGSYHEICDVGWDDLDAQMVCNYWFGSDYVGEVYQSVPFSSPYIIQDVSCDGSYVYSFRQCNFSPATSPECTGGGNHSARFMCREVCTEGDTRLVDRQTSYNPLKVVSGTVQVCINQRYGYVCSDEWDDREADVVCRSISSSYRAPFYENTASTTSQIYGDIPVYHNSICNGTEADFNDCRLPTSDSNSSCASVGTVQCVQVITECYSEGRTRLTNVSSEYNDDGTIHKIEGRVEMCINRTYRSLCYQYWDPVDAQVFCQSYVPYRYYYRYTSQISGKPTSPSLFGYSKAGLAPYNVMCDGSEYSIEQCAIEKSHSSLFCQDPTTSAAGVQCIVSEAAGSCTDYTLRLSDQIYSYTPSGYRLEGLVEVCIGGSYHAICDEGWDDKDAQVVCTQIGYDPRYYSGTALYGLTSTVPLIAEDVQCFGNETNAFQCSYTTPPVTPRCYVNSNAAGVRCTQVRMECYSDNEGEIILMDFTFENALNIFTGGPSNISGRVGVCHNGVYDSVCDVNWDNNDASVMCRILGINAIGTPLYGLPTGRNPVSLENVRCTGNETHISNCPTSPVGEISNPVCLEANRSAGVTCTTVGCVNGIFRLMDGPTFFEGRVEVCYNNEWLSVCDVGSDKAYATKVCERIFHMGGNTTNGSAYGPGTGEQLVLCKDSGSYYMYETFIEECIALANPDARRLCTHDRDVGVRCQPGPLLMSITSTGTPTIGSTSFALQCSATQFPWETRLDSNQWYKDSTLIPDDGPILVEVTEDVYEPFFFVLYNIGYKYSNKLTFSQPLTLSDRGEYSCSVSVQLSYPDGSTYLLTNSTSYSLIIEAPSPAVSVQMNGTQLVGTHLEVHCFVELPTVDFASFVTIDYFNASFGNLSSFLEVNPLERIQLLPTQQHNVTHYVRTLILDPLKHEDQHFYYCVANYSTSYLLSPATVQPVFIQVYSNESESDLRTLHGMLPFGSDHGDSVVPEVDDGHSQAISLSVNVITFGSRKNQIYVNTNGLLSLGDPFTRASSYGFTFDKVLSPHIVAPFWDDIDVTKGGTIYYRQDTDPALVEQLEKEIAIHYPKVSSFHPLLVFVATWDRVAAYSSSFDGLVNTFQVAIATDGMETFVRFSYGDIQWGGPETLIGLSAGDGRNFITHPASLSSFVLSLDNTTFTYQAGQPIVPPLPECSDEGELLTHFNNTSDGQLSRYEGTFEICVGGFYGSVCDIGWNQIASHALCYSQFGSGYVAEPIYSLGYPQRRYIAQNFNCSDSNLGLRNCSYDTSQSISSMCYVGPHVAGVRCTEMPPAPSGLHGLCPLVVWNRPMQLPWSGINGYDVKLYHPQSPHQSVIRHVGSNGTFCVLTDEDRLAGYTYFKVRVLYNGVAGQWSDGVFIGCDEPTTPEPEQPRIYFELKGNVYLNNSAIPLANIGEGTNALFCKTDKVDCCGMRPNRFGQFYYPNGVQVPINIHRHGFYRNRGEQLIRLNRRQGITSPTGSFRCEIPNADDVMVKIYITLT